MTQPDPQRDQPSPDPYAAVDQPAPIDPETLGLLWRINDGLTTLAERLVQAVNAAAIGPGASDTGHILTRNRHSHPPTTLRTDGTIADLEVVTLRRLRKNATGRLRTFVYWLEDELAEVEPGDADATGDERNVGVRRSGTGHLTNANTSTAG
jgi:hypothetical protein